MKQIINGKKYDTETARKIADYWNKYTGFQCVLEELYIKKTGEYFLYGKGDALSIYAEYCGSMKSGGECIIPLTETEAKKWVEENVNYMFETIFGECEE